VAIRSTIFKFALDVADIDRGYYATHALTVARHPSETDERMMIRVLAFALNASESLEFGKGLSSDDEPALWDRDLTGRITHWIEVGLPDERLLRRACGRADRVTLYAYGNERAVGLWWEPYEALLKKQTKLDVFAVAPSSASALAKMADRSASLQVVIQDGDVWIGNDEDRWQLEMRMLKQIDA
jgi:uncharacterized protein YaeQ